MLRAPFDYFQEIWNLAELLYPLQLESDRLISVKPAAVQDFQAGILLFYRHARREGIQLLTGRFSRLLNLPEVPIAGVVVFRALGQAVRENCSTWNMGNDII